MHMDPIAIFCHMMGELLSPFHYHELSEGDKYSVWFFSKLLLFCLRMPMPKLTPLEVQHLFGYYLNVMCYKEAKAKPL